MMKVQATHAGGTIMGPCAVSRLTLRRPHLIICVRTSYSRGLTPSRATSFHLTRPSQLSLFDPPRDALLSCPPARHLFPFLPCIQFPHRLRGA